MSAYLSQQLQETIRYILGLSVSVSSYSQNITLRKVRTTYNFSQSLSPAQYQTLAQFMQGKASADGVSDKQIVAFLQYEAQAQVEEQSKRYMRRVRWGVLYFFASLVGFFMLSYIKPGVFIQLPNYVRMCTGILWFGGVLLLWFNRIYIPGLKAAVKEDELTLYMCEYAYMELPKRKRIKLVLQILSVILMIAAFVWTRSCR